MLSLFAGVAQIGFGATEECVWHEAIMQNTTFHRLANEAEGESLVIVDHGNGSYPNGNSDVHFYSIYKINATGLSDLQAHVELAKISDTTYIMEIYHSVPNGTFSFEMPYTYTVQFENAYLTVLRIEDTVCTQQPPQYVIVETAPTELGSSEGCVWHEEIMQNVTFKGLLNICDGFTPLIVYEGGGNWSRFSDVHFYLVYTTNATGINDLQAHIELAKIGDTTYLMEIYHSKRFISIEMPFDFTIERNWDYFKKVIIEAPLCEQ